MNESRRMRRMERNNRKGEGLGLNLIPMMDVLTVLVLFLLFHSFNGEMPEQRIELPDSVVDTRPRETLAIVVNPEAVLIQGAAVVSTSELYEDRIGMVVQIKERLEGLEREIGITAPESKEITLLADKTIPFKVLKKIMSTCTASGYGRISLAVVQKVAKI
ncbi:MAG TPA: biopolymer transporter ExbD [Nitrospirota bacterium]